MVAREYYYSLYFSQWEYYTLEINVTLYATLSMLLSSLRCVKYEVYTNTYIYMF